MFRGEVGCGAKNLAESLRCGELQLAGHHQVGNLGQDERDSGMMLNGIPRRRRQAFSLAGIPTEKSGSPLVSGPDLCRSNPIRFFLGTKSLGRNTYSPCATSIRTCTASLRDKYRIGSSRPARSIVHESSGARLTYPMTGTACSPRVTANRSLPLAHSL
jgi:hypothetical protein